MRLLHVNSYEIREFVEGNVPDYAILSHTWGEQEVTYKDMKKGNADKLKGYQKILGCCDQSRLDGFEYVWIDTCCIDKRSSSELSEAINSMYRWYQEACVCYAYLEDVHNVDQDDANHTKLKSSRWFTRGWTLQELIAPQIVVFFTNEWSEIGTRTTMQGMLTTLTGIRSVALEGSFVPDDFSVAQKMSWASKRKTTRIEDEAYCLLGLFGVSMPLIYGEGSKAFRRLQEEIMKQSDDETIFAWKEEGLNTLSCLARSPSSFQKSGSFKRFPSSIDTEAFQRASPFAVTNKGIQISLPIIEDKNLDTYLRYTGMATSVNYRQPLAILDCHEAGREDQYIACIFHETDRHGTYMRSSDDLLFVPTHYVKQLATTKQIYLLIDSNIQREYATQSYKPTYKIVNIQPFPRTLAPVRCVTFRDVFECLTEFRYKDNGCMTAKIKLANSEETQLEIARTNKGGAVAYLTFQTVLGEPMLISLGFNPENTMIAAIGRGIPTVEGDDSPEFTEAMWKRAKRLMETYPKHSTISCMAGGVLSATVRNTDYVLVVTVHAE